MNDVRRLKATWLGARYGGAVSAVVGGAFADRLWFTPWHVGLSERAQAREAGWLASTAPLTIPFGDGLLAGFTAGQGPTVLLVHGWGDRASRLGAFIEPLVEAGHRVVGVDLPAHGGSTGRTTNAYEAAAAIRAIADHVGPVYAVIAHSMGGMETLVAIRDGLAVDRMILLASAVRLEHAMSKFSAMFGIPERAMRGLRTRIERRFGAGVFTDFSADVIADGLAVPGLLFHDRSDTQVDFGDGQRLAAAWSGGRLITTEGLGHDRLVRDPAVVQAATSFIAQGQGVTRSAAASSRAT